jgi:hypothetical protein
VGDLDYFINDFFQRRILITTLKDAFLRGSEVGLMIGLKKFYYRSIKALDCKLT